MTAQKEFTLSHTNLAIKPRSDHGGDEELRAVRVRAAVGHRQNARLGVLQLEVLVGELRSVD